MTYIIDATYDPSWGRYGIWIAKQLDGERHALTSEGLELKTPGEYCAATAYFDKPQLEVLMSRLWDEGIRPSNWGHDGQVAALKDHLQDMRRLVFNGEAGK
jgi:hypothetical protein